MKRHLVGALIALSFLAVSVAQAADAPATPLKVTTLKRPEDKAVVSVEKGEVIVTVTSASGIGDVTLEKTGDKWPDKVTVILQYADGKPYTKLEGLGGSFLVQGKVGVVLPASTKDGTGTVNLSKTPPPADAKLLISWVDFFR